MSATMVSKEEFWPLVLEAGAIGELTTGDAVFDRRARCVFRVLESSLIAAQDVAQVECWEDVLAMAPAAGLGLVERKAAVLRVLCENLPFTVALLPTQLRQVLGEKKFLVESLEDEGRLVLHTDRADETQLAAVSELMGRVIPRNLVGEQYNHHMEIAWRDINKYATCVTYEDMNAVNPNYMDDLTSDGWWVYPLPKLKQYSPTFGTYANHLTTAQRNKFTHFVIDGDIAHVLDGDGNSAWPRYTYAGFAKNSYLEEFRCFTNGAERCSSMFHKCYRLTKYRGALLYCKKADSMFDGCVLDKDSVLHIAETLCDFSGTETNKITLGIHIDHEQDEEVLAALTQIEGKGWSVVAQYNGQPSAAASAFGWGRLIYARMHDCELPDGSITRHLDWGHYVTHPEDYETFRSLEAAYGYFGLEQPEGEATGN